jgi:hypothetical protein
MNNTGRRLRRKDISEMLCDACLARLEQWLVGETTPHEFLECLLITSEEPKLERIFCPRCTEKLYRLQASLLSQLDPVEHPVCTECDCRE